MSIETQNSDKETLKRKVMEAVNTLPQRSVIPDAVAQDWVDGIVERDPERALWHVDRARGIGGSEIGELVLSLNEMDPYLTDPSDISREKLLQKLPDPSNKYMRRGTQLEQLARRVFELTASGRTRMDGERLARLTDGPSPKHEFAVGNPDDVFELDDGRINPVDYKVRSTLDWDAPTPLTYIAQVHWYSQIMQDHSGGTLDIGPLTVAQLDIPNELSDSLLDGGLDEHRLEAIAQSIAQANVRGFGMSVRNVDFSQKLMDDALNAAHIMWHSHVMQGKPFFKRKTLDVPDEQTVEKARALSQQVAVAKVAEKAAQQKMKPVQEELATIGHQYDLSKADPEKDTPLSISQNAKLNADAAASALIAEGVPRESLQKSTGYRLNPDKALEYIKTLGGDPQLAMDIPWDTQAIKGHLKQSDSLDAEHFSERGFTAQLGRSKEVKPVVERSIEQMQEHISAWQSSDSTMEQASEDDPDDDETMAQSGLSLA